MQVFRNPATPVLTDLDRRLENEFRCVEIRSERRGHVTVLSHQRLHDTISVTRVPERAECRPRRRPLGVKSRYPCSGLAPVAVFHLG